MKLAKAHNDEIFTVLVTGRSQFKEEFTGMVLFAIPENYDLVEYGEYYFDWIRDAFTFQHSNLLFRVDF